MKTVLVLFMMLPLLASCAAPQHPSWAHIADEVMAGRMTADDVRKTMDDYNAAVKEHQESLGYKLTVAALVPVMLFGSAASDPYFGYRGHGYRGQPVGYCGTGGCTVVTTTPIGGGAYQTTIKGYK